MTKENDFKITMQIAKSYERDEDDGGRHMYIQGIATGTGVDRHGERMAKSAVDAFKKAIEEGTVLGSGEWSLIPLRSGHRNEWDDVLGWVTKASIDDDYNLWIEAELDDSSAHARDLFTKLHRGTRPGRPLQLGLSVAGRILRHSIEWNGELTKNVRVIEDVKLREISVVGSPAFPTAYVDALVKSVDWEQEYPDEFGTKESTMAELEKNETTETPETQATEGQNTEETVEETVKTEQTQESNAAEEANTADPQAELVKAVSDLTNIVGDLTETVKNMKPAQEAEVSKSEESTDAEQATEAEQTDDSQDITKAVSAAVTEALGGLKLDVLAKEIDTLKGVVEELSDESSDRSLAVRKAKEEEKDPLETFKSMMNDPSTRKNPIGAALGLQYQD